jgi:hypothetical protein
MVRPSLIRSRMVAAASVAVLLVECCSAAPSVVPTSAQSVETISAPSECSDVLEPGDHAMVRYDLVKVGEAAALFRLNDWEQQHFEVAGENTPAAFTQGLLGMCAGEVRKLTFGAAAFDITGSDGEGNPPFTSTLTLITVTKAKDYEIFSLIDSGNVGGILDMVDNHTGVNAVDQFGNSALMSAVQLSSMSAVQTGGNMQMAFAALLNSWRPKVHVNFAKPSGHSALFYAVTQAEGDVKGNMILKALLKRGAEPNVALKQPDAIGWVSSAAGVVLVLEGVPLSCGRSTSWL